MKKISVDHKRKLDDAVTKQLLGIQPIRSELEKYTTAFIAAFNADTVPLFGPNGPRTTLGELSSLSVKGGLGIANLKAQAQNPAPNHLVWNAYIGDCDFNLLIEKSAYPPGIPTGEVMAAVAMRIKILLIETIAQTRFATLAQLLANSTVQPPLYLCSQIEALSQLVLFLGQDLTPEIQAANFQPSNNALAISKCLADLAPSLAGIRGPDIERVFQMISGASSNQFLVYRDQREKLFFVCDIGRVKSEWFDVDYSFFPYAPGRLDSLGYEVSELAITQQKDRQVGRKKLAYDVFKVVTSDFTYTESDRTGKVLGPFQDSLYMAGTERREQGRLKSPYNLSLYANNLIDDFALIRTALRFSGLAVSQPDDIAEDDYTAEVTHGAAKCEFVDVAIPRIASPEWFYLQGRNYYDKVPANPQPNQAYVKVCNWEYQCEENFNLLIELAAGHSHSARKAFKRIARLGESWGNCTMAAVFPRPGSNIPAPVSIGNFNAPALLVSNFAEDYQRLYGMTPLTDDYYRLVFEPLFRFHSALAAFGNLPRPTDIAAERVINAAGEVGRIGIAEMVPAASVDEAPLVSKFRGLADENKISCDWALAAMLLLKASRIGDLIWFPLRMLAKVTDAAAVNAAGLGIPQVADDDIIMLTRSDSVPGQWLTLTVIPSGALQGLAPVDFEGPLALAGQRLTNRVRSHLLHANNQMLRIAYGQILNVLLRAGADSYMADIIPLDG